VIKPVSYLTSMPEPLLGLDVSACSVKLVELGRNRRGELVLERRAQEYLQPGWIVEGRIDHFEEVAEVVRRVVRSSGSRTRQVAMALPVSAVITRTLVIPAGLSDQERLTRVETEAVQNLAFSLDEVSLDFCEMGASAHRPGDVELFMAAARKEGVFERQGLADAAGLKPLVMDVDTHASRLAAARVIDALHPPGMPALVALFEVGALVTRLQLLSQGAVLYDRPQPGGGAQLTQRIAALLGCSFDEAEIRKRSGELPPEYPSRVLQPFLQELAQEMDRSLQCCFTSTPYNQVDLILLGGASAALPGLSETLTLLTAFPSRVINPFEGMGISATSQRPGQDAPAYLTATGLALRRFIQ
jgi:type IV pilus assembly protein PilM